MDLKTFKEKTKIQEIKTNQELRTHLVTYIAVNLGLFLLNMMTSASFPWFLFVVGGWGIGMASHWGELLVASKNLQEVNVITEINENELNTLINFQKSRHDFYLHIISNVAVSIYLLMINIITSPGFMWSFIPIIAMAVGIASHWGPYTNKKSYVEYDENIEVDLGEDIPNTQLQKAITLRNSIITVIDEIRVKFKYFAADLLPKIDSYVETIKLLTKKEEDLERSLKQISISELQDEKSKIIDKRDKAESDRLITEYNNFIEEIDNHIVTIKRLEEQKELLQLKIITSINSLKHLNLELVGMKSKTTVEDTTILEDFDKKSADLALYYKDLLESYDEVHK
ncbi:MAG: 2TM domain-containing protein [Spirochaetaceae bacterium]